METCSTLRVAVWNGLGRSTDGDKGRLLVLGRMESMKTFGDHKTHNASYSRWVVIQIPQLEIESTFTFILGYLTLSCPEEMSTTLRLALFRTSSSTYKTPLPLTPTPPRFSCSTSSRPLSQVLPWGARRRQIHERQDRREPQAQSF